MPAADDLLIEPSGIWENQTEQSREAENPDVSAWLLWLAELLPATRCVARVRVDKTGQPLSVICSTETPSLPDVALVLAARACLTGSRQHVQTQTPEGQILAVPIPPGEHAKNDRAQGVSSALLLISDVLSKQQQGTLIGLIGWALRSLVWAERAVVAERLCNSQALLEPTSVQSLLELLSLRFDGSQCILASMQERRGKRHLARIVAISGQRRVDSGSGAVRKLAEFMEDMCSASLPASTPVYEAGPAVTASNSDVFADEADLPVRFCVPLRVHQQLLMICLRLPQGQGLSVAIRQQLVQELVPAVQSAWLARELNASLRSLVWQRLAQRYRERSQGPGRRLMQVCLIAAVLAIVLYPVEKRVSAEVYVEAAERHVLIAPQDGFVKSVKARAGDRVVQGELLATLDDDDLLRQVDKWSAEEQKNQQDYLGALAMHDRVELSSLRENGALIQTELKQVQAQLARQELRAPIAGIVLSDSVEDALGSAVKAGQILFEVGSSEQYRLALQVPERGIAQVASGQRVTLRMTADPKQRRYASVDMVIPIATARQGQNTFKVYAVPDAQEGVLRPGMKGIGKVLVGRASRLSQWAGSLWSRCVWLAWKLGLSR